MQNPSYALTQEVGTLTGAAEHISFIRRMLEKHTGAGERKNELIEKIRFAEQRATDSVLHLAVLGEFSSGKSTFINALLKQRLLKSARVATTASATYITYGSPLSVSVNFSDGRSVSATALKKAGLANAIARLKGHSIQPNSIRDLIDFVTADQDVANAVSRVDISLPHKNLKAGLSIIDTPGIGAGAGYTRAHTQITQAVVENSADAAIVLIPSAQPMSDTLISFLQSTARRFLHRCVFVVTAMDSQEEKDRATIMAFVHQCLTKKLGLKNPMVCECAAITALPTIGQLPSYKRSLWSFWQQQFETLESAMFRELLRQRNLIISERLVYLFQAIFAELRGEMESRQQVVEQGIQYLEESSVENLEKTLIQLLEQGIQKISLQGNRCRVSVTAQKIDFKSRLRAKVDTIVDDASWAIMNDYGGTVEPKIAQAAAFEGQGFLNTIDSDVSELKRCFIVVSAEFERQFERSYSGLKSLGGSITIPATSVYSLSIPAVKFSSATSFIEQAHQEDNQRMSKGAMAGAAVGLFLGPLGAVAGAAIGGAIGHGSANQLETCREGVKGKVNQDIDQYVERYATEVTGAIAQFEKDAIADLGAIAQSYLDEYGTVVDNMLRRYRQREQQLALKAKGIKDDMAELNRRRQTLEALNSKLINTHIRPSTI